MTKNKFWNMFLCDRRGWDITEWTMSAIDKSGNVLLVL